MDNIRLICLPFAGGTKYSYREYATLAPSFVAFDFLEYPGHGRRSREPLLRNINSLVDDVFKQIRGRVDNQEYAIYGHSMGALAAFLLARELKRHSLRLPLRLFCTGTVAPSARKLKKEKIHQLGKKEFLDKVIKLDGVPEEVVNNHELLDYYEPILRADFEAVETYVYEESEPFDIPITVITGTEEDMEREDVEMWQKESKSHVDFLQMSGKHFFIFRHGKEIMDIVSEKLASHLKIISK